MDTSDLIIDHSEADFADAIRALLPQGNYWQEADNAELTNTILGMAADFKVTNDEIQLALLTDFNERLFGWKLSDYQALLISSGGQGVVSDTRNYAAAKAGVIGFTKSMAREVASRGVTVNTVAPGFIETDMTKALNDDQRAATLSAVPAGRLGDPKEIASAVVFLASPEAAYITGETLHVNGGMYMV